MMHDAGDQNLVWIVLALTVLQIRLGRKWVHYG